MKMKLKIILLFSFGQFALFAIPEKLENIFQSLKTKSSDFKNFALNNKCKAVMRGFFIGVLTKRAYDESSFKTLKNATYFFASDDSKTDDAGKKKAKRENFLKAWFPEDKTNIISTQYLNKIPWIENRIPQNQGFGPLKYIQDIPTKNVMILLLALLFADKKLETIVS